MKKSIIAAGAASVALAAMPIVGVFAAPTNFSTGPFTDVIQTTIAESCTFGRGTKANKDVTPSTVANSHSSTESWQLDNPSTGTDTLNPAISVTPAATTTGTETPLGTSKFYVICNDTDGYQVTVSASDLTLPVGTVQNNDWEYTKTITSPSSATKSYWRIAPSDTQLPATGASDTVNYSDIANDIISTKSSAENGHDFTVEYKAFAILGQDAGTYSATAAYTAAQL